MSLTPAISATLPFVTHGAINHSEFQRLGLRPDAVIDFSANSNPYGPHPAVVAAVQAAVSASTLARYPDRDYLDLRAALAAVEGVTSDWVMAGNGANELIHVAALAVVTPGSRHLIVTPTFGEYAQAIGLRGGQVFEYRPTHPDLRGDVEAVAALIEHLRPDSIWLCNPNNPTGQQWNAAELAYLRQLESAQRAWWVVDESYHHFAAAPVTLKSKLESGNLIILRSLTKDMALAGLRLGYAMAAPPLLDLLRRVQPAWSVNALAQAAGIAALQPEVLAWRNESLEKVQQHARQLWSKLRELGLTVLPTSTPYGLVKVGQAAEFRRNLLLAGILVRDCTSFGLPDCIRAAARRPEENERLLTVIGAIVSDR
jgi:threonine-phosphate decarboxylase